MWALPERPPQHMTRTFLRYDVRRDPRGWSVFDGWTNQVVTFAQVPQGAMSHTDAVELADFLNRRVQPTMILQ